VSREKECKCCHEWWYASVIKEDLCPNCYYYFKQLKQQLAEKDKEIEDCKRNELYEENMKILAVKNQKQLAIQELEKVKNFVNDLSGMVGHEWRVNRISILEQLDQQINELKGEKDVEG